MARFILNAQRKMCGNYLLCPPDSIAIWMIHKVVGKYATTIYKGPRDGKLFKSTLQTYSAKDSIALNEVQNSST